MINTRTDNISHLRMVAIKTIVITAASVAGMLLCAILLNLFMFNI